MSSPLSPLGVDLPVLAAPMAGGPSTPALVAAAARAGSLGFLAAGYKTVDQLAGQIAEVRAQAVPFGVNLFVPNPVPVDRAAFARYATALAPEADGYDIQLGLTPVEDDDAWPEKVDLLLGQPVPVVGFTFNRPDPAGAGLLAVQALAAGGHSGTWTPERVPGPVPLPDLVASVRAVTSVPVV